MLRIFLNNLKGSSRANTEPLRAASPDVLRASVAPESLAQADMRALAAEVGTNTDYASAYEALRRTLAKDDENFAALIALADLLLRQGDTPRIEEGLQLINRALALRPASALALSVLGSLLHRATRTGEAVEAFRLALAADPARRDLRYMLAFELFLNGQYREGFFHFSSRHPPEASEHHAWTMHLPRWEGESLAGRRVLIWTDWGGLGDELLFARYIAMVRDKYRPAELHVSCSAENHRLFSLIPGVDQCFSSGGVLSVDCHTPLLDLPCIFGTDLDSIPGSVPYLHPAPVDCSHWAARLAGLRGLKVGICWGSGVWNQGEESERMRLGKSMSLALLEGLAAEPDVHLISLQKGKAREELPRVNMAIHDFDADLRDMADTAALIACLDLVITVDTSMSHLAGALGKPALVLLSQGSGSFWLTETETSPWYPCVRLLRQPYGGDWSTPAQRAIELVRRFASNGKIDLFA